MCALYLPIYKRAKARAREARGESSENEVPLTRDEIIEHVPFRMNRISHFAFLLSIGLQAAIAISVFKQFGKRDECAPLVYWTAFVIAIFYATWLLLALSSCLLMCCGIVICPTVSERMRAQRRETEEA